MPEDVISSAIRRLGKQYSQLRRDIGLTQKEVSERSGMSVFTISTFESGHLTGLTISAYIKLLRAIDCMELIEGLLNDNTDKIIPK